MDLSKNLENLRFLQLYQEGVKHFIKININNEFPTNLRVFDV